MTAGGGRHVVHNRAPARAHFASCAGAFLLTWDAGESGLSEHGAQTDSRGGGHRGARRRAPAHRRGPAQQGRRLGAAARQARARRKSRPPARAAKRWKRPATASRCIEFLGAITYRARGRPKVVQFWRMKAAARPSRDVMKDIVAVEWLPLAAAVRRLSYPLEKLFLRHVGRRILKRRRRKAARRSEDAAPARKADRTPQSAPSAGVDRYRRALNRGTSAPQSRRNSCRNLMRAADSANHFRTRRSRRIHAQNGTLAHARRYRCRTVPQEIRGSARSIATTERTKRRSVS